jgi:hypothetical protein
MGGRIPVESIFYVGVESINAGKQRGRTRGIWEPFSAGSDGGPDSDA